VTGEPDAYYYFAGTIKGFPKGEAMLELLRSCGFANCDASPLTMGIVTVYTGQKAGVTGVQEPDSPPRFCNS
jgi:demethylmenaquinone methyltransferase/2-methoxy-6-polyprenyl-1,4-benzoquinol methylase